MSDHFHAIHLYRSGEDVVVAIEHDGKWVEVIREKIDSPFSHIVEPGGISACVSGKRKTAWP